MRTVVDGIALEHYKDFDVRESGIAVLAESKYKYAASDGLAPDDFLLDGLVLYLPLHKLKGGKFRSVDPFGHLCTVTGALWSPDGYLFDGEGNFIDLGTDASLTITGNLTLIVWVKLDVTLANQPDSFPYFISKEVSGFTTMNYRIMTSISTSVYEFRMRNAAGNGDIIRVTNLDATGLNDLAWHHIAAVWDRTGTTKGYFYEDAVEISGGVAGTDGDPYTAGSHVAAIGGTSAEGDIFLDGNIGEVWVYSKALSDAEISHHYNATKWRYT